MFKPKKGKRNAPNQMLMNTSPISPSTFSKNGIGPMEVDSGFDPGEAILSQLLLQSLDNDVDITSVSPQQRESAAVGLGLGLGIGFADLAMDSAKRDKIIMTCERRGSESTVGSSHNSHSAHNSLPLSPFPPHSQMHRFTLESTATLYEPSSPISPSGKDKASDLPLSTNPSRHTSVQEPPPKQEPQSESETQNPISEQPNVIQIKNDHATPRAPSPE